MALDKVAFDETVIPQTSPGAELDPELLGGVGLDATLADETLVPGAQGGARIQLPAAALRTTVLPKISFDGSSPQLKSKDSKRYEVLRPLGEGALGEVVLVQDNDIQRKVAMKKLKSERHQPATLHRFVEEIQMVGALDHPNIVPVHDVGVDEDGKFYFIMKYVEGQTLEDLIEQLREHRPEDRARFTPEARTHIFLDVLRALRCAHEDGIIHRDLKPANIMLGPFGEALVMDWGLAKRLGSSEMPEDLEAETIPEQDPEALKATGRFETQHGTLVGTPAYMSPEQARGDTAAIDERSDIYALSVLFHELLTLRHYLHDKNNLNALLFSISSDAPAFQVFQEGARTGIPPELLWFCLRGMSKDPEKRFQSVTEMEETLRAIISGDIEVQCPATFMKRLSYGWASLINRRPTLTIVIALLVVGFAIFGGVAAVATLV